MEFLDKEKPLTVAPNKKPQELKAEKTYFYEMPSGNVIATEAREAWSLHKKRIKQIGVSNGLIYAQAILDSQQILATEGLEKAQERLRRGYQEELESARGHFETPPNFDFYGNGAEHLRQNVAKYK